MPGIGGMSFIKTKNEIAILLKMGKNSLKKSSQVFRRVATCLELPYSIRMRMSCCHRPLYDEVTFHGPGLAHFSRDRRQLWNGRKLSEGQFVEKNVPVPPHWPMKSSFEESPG